MKPSNRSVVSFVLLTAGLTALRLVAAPQEPATDPSLEPFGTTIDVKVVNVEVQVTDEDGNPVTDLTADDFEIREDGRPVRITNFYRVTSEVPPAPEPVVQPAPLSGSGLHEAVAQIGPAPRPEDRKLRVVVFIDNFFTRPAERNRNMPALRQFLQRTLGPDDEAMVVVYDRALQVIQPFTSDHPRVYDALFEIENMATSQSELDQARRSVLQRIDEAQSADEAMLPVRPYADTVRNDVENEIEAVQTIVNDLAGLSGRKILVHVSSGLPMVAGGDLFYAVGEKFENSSAVNLSLSYDLSRRFTSLAGQANANGVAFYTIDAAGLRTSRSMAAEEQGLDTPMMGVRVESDRVANRQSPLRFMADETGGRAIVNQNNILPALMEVAAGLQTYYSLGFVSGHPGDNRYYGLRVDVARKGVTVRHRSGYRDKSLDVDMEESVRAALIHRAPYNPWGARIRSGEAEARDNGLFVVPIRIEVPLAEVELVPTPDYVRADLTFFFAAMDDSARLSPVTSAPIGVRIPADHAAAAAGESYLLNHQLLMRRGTNTIAVGIWDRYAGRSVILTHTVTVP